MGIFNLLMGNSLMNNNKLTGGGRRKKLIVNSLKLKVGGRYASERRIAA